MPAQFPKPDQPVSPGDLQISAKSLNRVFNALLRQVSGGPNTEVNFYGDRATISSDNSDTWPEVEHYLAELVVLEELDDMLKCTWFKQENDGIDWTQAGYDEGRQAEDEDVFYVAKPKMLQAGFWNGRTRTVDGHVHEYAVVGGVRTDTNLDTMDEVNEELSPAYITGEMIFAVRTITGLKGPDGRQVIWADLNNAGRKWQGPASPPLGFARYNSAIGPAAWEPIYFNVSVDDPTNGGIGSATGVVRLDTGTPDNENSGVVHFVEASTSGGGYVSTYPQVMGGTKVYRWQSSAGGTKRITSHSYDRAANGSLSGSFDIAKWPLGQYMAASEMNLLAGLDETNFGFAGNYVQVTQTTISGGVVDFTGYAGHTYDRDNKHAYFFSAYRTPSDSTFVGNKIIFDLDPGSPLTDGYASLYGSNDSLTNKALRILVAGVNIANPSGLPFIGGTGTPGGMTFKGGVWISGSPTTSIADGNKGDLTVSSSGTDWQINAGVVTTTELGGDVTSAGKNLLDDANPAAQRTTLGLGTVSTLDVDTDTTLAANSDLKVPSQKAVKAYVDTAVTGLLDLKGGTNASGGPNYPAASKGDAYYVTTAGKVGGASGKTVDVGDVYLATADNAGGDEAAVGTSWIVLEHNLTGALVASNNLSDLTNTTTARSNLGLVIGTNVQAYDATLATISGLTPGADTFIYFTATDVASTATVTLQGRQLLDDTSFSAMRTTLGLVAVASSGSATDLTTGTLDGDRLAAPTTTKRGGVKATGTPSNKFYRDDDTWQTAGLDINGLSAAVLEDASVLAQYKPSATDNKKVTISAVAAYYPSPPETRLALGSDASANASIGPSSDLRVLPWGGGNVSLYYGSEWRKFNVGTGVTLTMSGLTASAMHDVFLYFDGTNVLIETVAWSGGVQTTLTTNKGLLVKNSDPTRLYMGSFWASSTTQSYNSIQDRWITNWHNRIPMPLKKDYSSNWVYGTATWREVNATAFNNNYVRVALGQAATVYVESMLYVIGSVGSGGATGVGVGSNTAPSGHWCETQQPTPSVGWYCGAAGAGMTTIYGLEIARAGALNFYGQSANAVQGGLTGWVMG